MKRLITVILFCLTLSSCAKNHSSDEHFIHAVEFGQKGDNITFSAVCEKMQGDESEYFVIEESGKDLKGITESINKKYSNCYFATNEIYFFSENLETKNMKKLIADICQSSEYPLKAKAATTDDETVRKIFNGIDDEQDIKSMLKEHGKKSKNAAVYFGKFMEEKANEE